MPFRLDNKAHVALTAAVTAMVLLTLNTLTDFWKPKALYSTVTGYALVATLVLMWILPAANARASSQVSWIKSWHEWGGIALLSIFCLHAAAFKHNLLLWLSVLILAESIVGALPPRLLLRHSEGYVRVWWFLHVVIGCAITCLALIHIYAVYAYTG